MIETVTCPNCKKRLQLSAEHLGQQVQCPSCETAFTAGDLPPPVVVTMPSPVEIKTPMSLDAPPSETPRARKSRDDDDYVPRARRRARPAPLPKASSGYRMPILYAVLGGLVVIGIVIGSLNQRRPNAPPPMNVAKEIDTTPREWQMPPRSDVPNRMLTDDEQKVQANAFFQHFSTAMRLRTVDNERAAYDTERMIGFMFAQNLLPNAWRGEHATLLRLIRERIPTVVLNPSDRWGDYAVKLVKQPQPRELIVVTRHPNAGLPGALHFRWWLKHDGVRWLIQELEDIDYGVRLTTLLALSLEPIPNNTGVLPNPHLRRLDEAAKAVLSKDQFGDAERLLKDARVDDLARPFAALHHLLLALAMNRQQRFQDAVRFGEMVQNVEPDMPGNDYLLSIALSNLNRSQDAFLRIKKVQEWLGDDPIVNFELAFVHQQMRRFGEATAYYRKVLDVEPDNRDAFFQLLRCLAVGAKNDDIAARFNRLKNPQERFEQLANECWLNRNTQTLEILASAMLKRSPFNAEAEFYLALALTDRQNSRKALDALEGAMKRQLDEQRRDYYQAEFARAMAERDQALEAYQAMPNALQVFRPLAESLKNFGKTEELQRLIDLHAKSHADDPYLLLYQADTHLREEKYALADGAFTKAFARINDPGLADRFRMDRVRARYQVGDMLGAYKDLPPQRMTFQQLADLCWVDKKYDEVRKLIDLHAQNDALDPQIGRFRTRLDFAMNRFDEAGKRLKAALDANPVKEQNRVLLEDFLFDAVDADQALEGYRRCPDQSLALEVLANDLLEANRHQALDEILAEHRKNHPNDPIMFMLLGERAAAINDWVKAVQSYKQGWKTLPEAQQARWSYGFLRASYKLGKAVEAYQETGNLLERFGQLSSMILADKNVDLFEKLLQVHLARGGRERELAAYGARLQILRGKPADAAITMPACLQNVPQLDRRRVSDSFLADLAAFDVAVETYRCMPDKLDAFSIMTWRLHTVDRAKELERLIAEHAKHHADDPRLIAERAELHMLRREFAEAEAQFVLLKNNTQGQDLNGRFGLIRARVKLGKAVETYHEFGKNAGAFQEIAGQCLQQKNGEQLEQLLAAHRQAFPKATHLANWEVDIRWVKKDYEKTVQMIRADSSARLKNNSTKWKCEGYLIRSLVHLKKSDEAVREAEKMNERKHGPQSLLALALASTGDVQRTIAYLENAKGNRYLIEDSYRDEDLGPLLRSEAYREFQQRHPPPPVVPPVP